MGCPPPSSSVHTGMCVAVPQTSRQPTRGLTRALCLALLLLQFNDDQLQFSRLDFVKLADIEQVRRPPACCACSAAAR